VSDTLDPFDPEEWGDKPECSAFETALDMRAQGVLAPTAIPVLEVHLATCDSCREYQARSARVDAVLGIAIAPPDWVRLREAFGKRLQRARRIPLVMACWILSILGSFVALTWLFTGQLPSWRILAESFVVTMLVIAYGFYVGVRRLRRMLTDPDPIAAERRALETRLRTARAQRWWLPLGLVMAFGQALAGFNQLGDANRNGGAQLVMWLLGAAGIVYVITWLRRDRRRVERELAELR
jgi:membrane protein YdbS with pleckstrin-like domain